MDLLPPSGTGARGRTAKQRDEALNTLITHPSFLVRAGLSQPLHPAVRVFPETEDDSRATRGFPTGRKPCRRTPFRGTVFLHSRGAIESPRGGCRGSGSDGTRPSLAGPPGRR